MAHRRSDFSLSGGSGLARSLTNIGDVLMDRRMRILSRLCFAAVFGILLATGAQAGDKTFKTTCEFETCNFRDYEFQIDAFGAFLANPEFETRGRVLNTGVGGGGGLNFFFLRYFGVGVEGLWYGNGGTAETMIIGNVFIRYPICKWNMAPYLMIGGGGGFGQESVGFGHIGGGGEWRIHPNVGLFCDSRFVYGAPDLLGLTRVGVRFAF